MSDKLKQKNYNGIVSDSIGRALKFQKDIDKYKKKEKELNKIIESFISDYPKDKILQLKIKEYVIGFGSENSSFCYRIENELKDFGDFHGATSYKFGLYYGKTKSDPTVKYRTSKSKFGSNAEDALVEIKKEIVALLDAGEIGNDEKIKLCKLAPTYRGKILATYFSTRYLAIFSNDHLNYFLEQIGEKSDFSNDQLDKQKKLIEWKQSQPHLKDYSLYLFMRYLYFVYGRPTKNIILTDEQENAVIANSDFRKDSVQSNYDETRKKRSEPVIINGQKQYERDINEAKKALKRANYSCEICNEHPTFIRKKDGLPYTEPHHLIPMSFSSEFSENLDREQNIVSLCSNCHNQIHYGEGAKELILQLFDKRKDVLERIGIKISKTKLLKMYK